MSSKIRCSQWRGILVAAAVFAGGLMVAPAAQADILGFKNGNPNVWSTFHANIGSGDPPSFDGNSVTITTDISDEHNSAFYNNPQIVTGFMATFTFNVTGSMMADGAAFVIHNDPRGAMAIGDQDGGSSLGYQGIQSSAAIGFNIYAQQNPLHPGTGHFGETDFLYNDTSGNTKNPGGSYLDTTPVELTTNGPIQVTLTYDNVSKNLVETLADSAGNTFTQTYDNIDIPTIVGGNTAYVGFTGGTGGAHAIQTFGNFTYIEMPEPNTAVLAAVGIVGTLWYCCRRRSRARS